MHTIVAHGSQNTVRYTHAHDKASNNRHHLRVHARTTLPQEYLISVFLPTLQLFLSAACLVEVRWQPELKETETSQEDEKTRADAITSQPSPSRHPSKCPSVALPPTDPPQTRRATSPPASQKMPASGTSASPPVLRLGTASAPSARTATTDGTTTTTKTAVPATATPHSSGGDGRPPASPRGPPSPSPHPCPHRRAVPARVPPTPQPRLAASSAAWSAAAARPHRRVAAAGAGVAEAAGAAAGSST